MSDNNIFYFLQQSREYNEKKCLKKLSINIFISDYLKNEIDVEIMQINLTFRLSFYCIRTIQYIWKTVICKYKQFRDG